MSHVKTEEHSHATTVCDLEESHGQERAESGAEENVRENRVVSVVTKVMYPQAMAGTNFLWELHHHQFCHQIPS